MSGCSLLIRSGGDCGANPEDYVNAMKGHMGKSVLCRGNSMCKGPAAGVCRRGDQGCGRPGESCFLL